MKRLILLVLFALFALFALPAIGQDEMTVYVLVRATDSNQSDGPMKQYAGTPVHADLTNQYVGGQVLPDFFQIVITDAASLQQIRDAYIVRWNQIIDYEQVSHDPVTDTYQLEVFTKPEYVSASGNARITRDQVENFLNEWNATVNGISLGRVSFTARMRDAIWSNGFWGMNVSQADFSEIAYDSATGVHTMEVDADNIASVIRSEVAGMIINRCGSSAIISAHPIKKEFTFECGRSTVRDAFKEDVKQAVDGVYGIRRWRITQAMIDLAIAAGGSIDVKKAQLLPYLHNLLDD